MKNLAFLITLFTIAINAQVGIGTTDPKGALDVKSNNTAFIPPRVNLIEDVTDGNGNEAPDGAIVYDISRGKTCYKLKGKWLCIGIDKVGNAVTAQEQYIQSANMTYVKASNTGNLDSFGNSVSISDDGSVMVVAAFNEDSDETGTNGTGNNDNLINSGAVYVFRRAGINWVQEQYLKANFSDQNDNFGYNISISGDGNYIAVSSPYEDSNETGTNGTGNNNLGDRTGAVYIYHFNGSIWTQTAYIKPNIIDNFDFFGYTELKLDFTGLRLVVSFHGDDSDETGTNGIGANNNAPNSGAVLVFKRTGTIWQQEAFIKAINTETNDYFGSSFDISNDCSVLVVGAKWEDSSETGIGGNGNNNNRYNSGAVYIYTRVNNNWAFQTYIKPSSLLFSNLNFGKEICVSGDGLRFSTSSTGGNTSKGKIYNFVNNTGVWSEEFIIDGITFQENLGTELSTNNDGSKLIIGTTGNRADTRGINAVNNISNSSSGAIYYYTRTGTTWTLTSFIKSSNSDPNDEFSSSIQISNDGLFIIASSIREESNATGINGNQVDNSFTFSGAVYIIKF